VRYEGWFGGSRTRYEKCSTLGFCVVTDNRTRYEKGSETPIVIKQIVRIAIFVYSYVYEVFRTYTIRYDHPIGVVSSYVIVSSY
jgi:hypothetical protein